MPHSILIVDDHFLIRLGLAELIENFIEGAITKSAATQKEASKLLRSEHFDLAIVDILLPDGNGLELIRGFRNRGIKWLVMSSMSGAYHKLRAKNVGASGFAVKSLDEEVLISAIKTVLGGGVYPDDFLQKNTEGDVNFIDKLSQREMTVFQLIADGKSVDQIATALCRARKTVNALRDRIRTKLNISSAAELSRFATFWLLDQQSKSP